MINIRNPLASQPILIRSVSKDEMLKYEKNRLDKLIKNVQYEKTTTGTIKSTIGTSVKVP